ncbi:MAG: peptidoglycan bridge formation glycyltransferase FemA/FemB family protein [Chloroflexi bacterium]|nr:peptidoglycan bridge formation glycyltransferase FemA/FemB family protein [Chloroflexota bacterium]
MVSVNSNVSILENPAARAWDDCVAARGGHLLQSSAWGELKTRFGWRASRVAVTRDHAITAGAPSAMRQLPNEPMSQSAHTQTIIAGAQILFRRLPLGLVFAYIPRGPVVDPADHNTVAALFDALCDAAKSRRAFALKIEPNWLDAIHNSQFAIRNSQFANSIQPRTTIHLDLTPDLDAILAQMKPKWRYNIRLAERKGVIVREGSADDLAAFYRLMQVTSARDQFAIHSEAYYRAAFELFTTRDPSTIAQDARLFVAEYAREPLAMIFVTAFGGEAIYLYGASSNAHRERMPNHALHWAAMQWAKARGCARYDLWGLGATTDADAHPAHGLYQFKQGFGGAVVQYASARDVVFSRWQYALYTRAVAWRRGAIG